MSQTLDRMSTLDAEFFYAEHHNVPMHIGSVAVFDGPAPTRADLMRLFEAKLPRVPRYRQVVRATPFQLLRPVWADDQEFAIRHHVRHVSVRAPGGPEQLGAMAAKLFALPLDRHRPLWEEWLLDGLEGGRWAILSKIHHCMVDGIGGNELMTLVFDTAPDERVPEAAPWVPGPRPSLAELAAGDLRDAVTRPLRQLAEVPGLFRLARRDDVLDYGRGLGRAAWDLAELVLRSLVPVSVRGPGEDGAITNRVSAVLANLPVGEADPLRRIDLIRQEMDQLKHTHQAVSAEVFTEMLGLVLGSAPMWLALGTQVAFRIRQPLVQTVTTNVPGPRSPLYVLGRPMTALYPYVPIGNAVRLSVAILSYVDTVSFGVTADYDAAPDLDTFTEGIRRSLAELGGRPAREGTGS